MKNRQELNLSFGLNKDNLVKIKTIKMTDITMGLVPKVQKMKADEKILLEDGSETSIKNLSQGEIKDYIKRLENEMLRAWREPYKRK